MNNHHLPSTMFARLPLITARTALRQHLHDLHADERLLQALLDLLIAQGPGLDRQALQLGLAFYELHLRQLKLLTNVDFPMSETLAHLVDSFAFTTPGSKLFVVRGRKICRSLKHELKSCRAQLATRAPACLAVDIPLLTQRDALRTEIRQQSEALRAALRQHRDIAA